jgi:hypothetical protein
MNVYARAAALLILLSAFAVTLCAQEAVTDSYYQAAAEAAGRGDHAAAARFARLGLAEVERMGPDTATAAQTQGQRLESPQWRADRTGELRRGRED